MHHYHTRTWVSPAATTSEAFFAISGDLSTGSSKPNTLSTLLAAPVACGDVLIEHRKNSQPFEIPIADNLRQAKRSIPEIHDVNIIA